ncbi:MAG: protein kinase, partial [Verrucomicrobiota bacterium]
SLDNSLRLWDASSGECIRSFLGHQNSVTSVAFSPDGQSLLSGSSDHSLRLWDASSGECIRSFQGHQSFVTSVAFSPDGQSLLSGSRDSSLRLWNRSTGKEIHQTLHHPEGAWATVNFSENRILHASSEAWRIIGWRSWDEEAQAWRIDPPQVPC